MQRACLRVSCLLDGEQKGGKHRADDEYEGHGAKDHPQREARWRPARPGGGIAGAPTAAPTPWPSHGPRLLTKCGWTTTIRGTELPSCTRSRGLRSTSVAHAATTAE